MLDCFALRNVSLFVGDVELYVNIFFSDQPILKYMNINPNLWIKYKLAHLRTKDFSGVLSNEKIISLFNRILISTMNRIKNNGKPELEKWIQNTVVPIERTRYNYNIHKADVNAFPDTSLIFLRVSGQDNAVRLAVEEILIDTLKNNS